MFRLRRLKAAAFITIAYCSFLLIYQTLVTSEIMNPSHTTKNICKFCVEFKKKMNFHNEYTQSNATEIIKIITYNNKTQSRKNISLDDIFISVKTTGKYHNSKLSLILKTWWNLAKDQTWIFTDTANTTLEHLTGGHFINTKCPLGHDDESLCCKTAVEYETFIKSGKLWFCHFDDDNYVNIPNLVKFLQMYDPNLDWYLGRSSMKDPYYFRWYIYLFVPVYRWFTFATFGAGVCLSQRLALRLIPIISNGKFVDLCKEYNFPDDIMMGYVIERMLNVKLTQVAEFHSHMEYLNEMPSIVFPYQITYSYGTYNKIILPGGFNKTYDPTRFLSLHCLLYPHFNFCPVVKDIENENSETFATTTSLLL